MLNPITYSEKLISDFLRYQLTTYPFTDERLHTQMRALLSLEQTRATPLMRGPFVSLSRSFLQGPGIDDLVRKGILHPHLAALAPHPNVYGHQAQAIESILSGKPTLVSTGTGSGKTECFLYPIISHCLKLRDEHAPPGVTAVLVYPMNALAEDQLGRLRQLLCGTGISFGMYVGKTKAKAAEVKGIRLPHGASRADYDARVRTLHAEKRHEAVLPPEERASREEMRTPGKQPRILLTNVKQLELLLTRHQDLELFDGARLDFLVFDEAHTFTGAMGAETACLIRRLQAYCGKTPGQTVCVATSATIADPEHGQKAGRDFASRFFGVEAKDVTIVGETYEEDLWADQRTPTGPLPGNPAVQLQTILDAVAAVEIEPTPRDAILLLKTAFQAITGSKLDVHRWQESLYERLAANEVVYLIAEALKTPRPLDELVRALGQRLGRVVPEEEIVAWLALGAASRKNGRPLLRPVVHAFVRGLGGAVVSFPEEHEGLRLWLSREDAAAADHKQTCLDVMSCTTCGQHYFMHFVTDFEFFGKYPGGGEAIQDRIVWKPLDEKAGGKRVVLLDRLANDSDDEDLDDEEPRNTAPVFLCRFCGALHPKMRPRCDGCGRPGKLVPLLAVGQHEDEPGKLRSCVACASPGGNRLGMYREPARPVRAQTVADVHVLAQSMIHYAERRRLLVFADNRQDAAFQAGWMADHGRRFRLRSLMFEQMTKRPTSVGDLAGALDDLLEADDDLSRALVPEIWRVDPKESTGTRHATMRRRYLRMQVLRELVTGIKQRRGLEPWGRMLVEYHGLSAQLPFFQSWGKRLAIEPEKLLQGVATLLDHTRRHGALHDSHTRMFSQYWHESDREISHGWIPLTRGGPKGLGLRRTADDKPGRVMQWLGNRGGTTARQAALNWGMIADDVEAFFEELWKLLTSQELGILVPVKLTGRRDEALPGARGAYQIDVDKLLLHTHHGHYRCTTCRRRNLRPTPKMACPAWRCKGFLTRAEESLEDYDLMVLDQRFAMVRPREHSAQVPEDQREMLERAFKGQSELVNTLVSTPTLELGVDIGALDAVLMRNVPPFPANYKQRAGRAGRRHRMAVNITYASLARHDRAYFAAPLKMLDGTIDPPRFNLNNQPMVRKHVHAVVLTALYRLVRSKGLPADEQAGLERTLAHCFPTQIKTYLFDEDEAEHVRHVPFDMAPLGALLGKHEGYLLAEIESVFAYGWPPLDYMVVEPHMQRAYVTEMAEGLSEVIRRLESRLRWALEQMARLDEVRSKKGTLDPEEDALRDRCDRMIKRLKGKDRRSRRDAEGFDDTYTYAVLAAEGFLPGYGLDGGAVVGYYNVTRFIPGTRDWELRRAHALALREYVPGNLIYANGHRFLPRFFHLQPQLQPTLFQVDLTNGAIAEVGLGHDASGLGLGSLTLAAVPICDVDLPHQSYITDDELFRFQLPVTILGYEQKRHGGGTAFVWGERHVTSRASVQLRLVNIGATSVVQHHSRLGYPLCLVCGMSRSPLASEKDRDEFVKEHLGRCKQPVHGAGFFADIVADAFGLHGCTDLQQAYSVAEALRQGVSDVLDVELGDLQLLAFGRPGETACDILLYDPMPGGSGLLQQVITRWKEVVAASLAFVEGCPSDCASACIDCLLNYRNAFYHPQLDRKKAAECLRGWGDSLLHSHGIPPLLPAAPSSARPTNRPEAILLFMLERAGFANIKPQHPIDLGKPLGTTTPDFYLEDPSGRYDGICIYLDGMSTANHGNEATRRRDDAIREELRNRAYEVMTIQYGQLTDPQSMRNYFYRLGRILLGKSKAESLRDDSSWFEATRQEYKPNLPW